MHLPHPPAGVLALNNAHAVETSLLDRSKLEAMWAAAYFATAVGACDAFLIAFEEGSAYDGANFLWFRRRLARFVYIDRIVTAPILRGRGLARRLYGELFARAAADDRTVFCCEINKMPPNPISDTFHEALGFRPVGESTSGPKSIRYLVREA